MWTNLVVMEVCSDVVMPSVPEKNCCASEMYSVTLEVWLVVLLCWIRALVAWQSLSIVVSILFSS